jgi:hypothetical protein
MAVAITVDRYAYIAKIPSLMMHRTGDTDEGYTVFHIATIPFLLSHRSFSISTSVDRYRYRLRRPSSRSGSDAYLQSRFNLRPPSSPNNPSLVHSGLIPPLLGDCHGSSLNMST